jgi:hypothetical protein
MAQEPVWLSSRWISPSDSHNLRSIGPRPILFGEFRCCPARRTPEEEFRALEIVYLLHDRLSVTVILFMAAVGAWGLFIYLRGQSLTGSYAGALAIGEALVLAQVAAGILVVGSGARAPSSTHYLYGITAVLVLPFAWSYFRDRDQRQALLIYSLIALFIFGLAIRGVMTGR